MAKYVLAVSGGVDSMVLLDLVARNYDDFLVNNFPGAKWPDDFVVAHFDHGIRDEESHSDARFVDVTVRRLYGLTPIICTASLPADTSEEDARLARYNFLNDVIARLPEPAVIVTAHHQDDLLETAIMNLVRGTGWRGLAPMGQANIVRPLLNWSKVDIVKYAIEHNLEWVEDWTNYSLRYFRNRLRAILRTWPDSVKGEMLDLINQQQSLRCEIEADLAKYVTTILLPSDDSHFILPRYDLIMLPAEVAMEVLHFATNGQLTRPQLDRLLLFAKTARPGKQMSWKNVVATTDKTRLFIQQNH